MSEKLASLLRLTLASLVSVSLFFMAVHVWTPLVFLALTPFLVACCNEILTFRVVWVSWVAGSLACFLIQYTLWEFSWKGVLLLSIYQGLSWIPAALGSRFVWMYWKLPLSVIWPITWGAGEALREWGPMGTIYGILATPDLPLWMLQTLDLGGIRMIGIPLAVFQGFLADLILLRWSPFKGFKSNLFAFLNSGSIIQVISNPRMISSGIVTTIVWLSVLVYGVIRLSEVNETQSPGPWVAVVQSNAVALSDRDQTYDEGQLFEELKRMSEQAAAQDPPPELIVWPESLLKTVVPNRDFYEAEYDPRMKTVFSGSQSGGSSEWSDDRGRQVWNDLKAIQKQKAEDFNNWVRGLGISVQVGTLAWSVAGPEDERAFAQYNASLRVNPVTGQSASYQAKVRRYPLGEYIPLKETWIGHWLEKILGPSRSELDAGLTRRVDELGMDSVRYVTAICNELKFSKLEGEWIADKPVPEGKKPFEVMVHVANEGVFRRNRTLEIFALCAIYRAIENRVTVVRSSNAGISGFWKPTGEAYGLVTNERGETNAGKGAPEQEKIAELVRYREKYEKSNGNDLKYIKEVERRIEEIEKLTNQNSVKGWSVQPVYLYKKQTLFQKTGDWLSPCMLVLTGLFHLLWIRKYKRAQDAL